MPENLEEKLIELRNCTDRQTRMDPLTLSLAAIVIIGGTIIILTIIFGHRARGKLVEWEFPDLLQDYTGPIASVAMALMYIQLNKLLQLMEGETNTSLKDLSNKEADRLAKENGYEDAHDLKDAYVDGEGSKFNIKVDTKTGEIYLEGLQNGVQIPTGLYK